MAFVAKSAALAVALAAVAEASRSHAANFALLQAQAARMQENAAQMHEQMAKMEEDCPRDPAEESVAPSDASSLAGRAKKKNISGHSRRSQTQVTPDGPHPPNLWSYA